MAGCKIEDIKEAMIKFIAPGKRTYEDLVKKGLIDNDKLTQYIRTGLKAKKADAINARFDAVLKGYEPEVETEESKQLVKDAEEFVKEIKAKDAKVFVNHSGGAIGSDIEWGKIGEEFGVLSNHYYTGVRSKDNAPNGNVEISQEDYHEGAKEAAKAAARNWGYGYASMKDARLLRNWAQVKYADIVYAIGSIVGVGENVFPDQKGDSRLAVAPTVTGGTGYAVGMAINHNKPVYVFNQKDTKSYKQGWYKWNGKDFVATTTPKLTNNFAGIGTRNINEAGKQAIKDVYAATGLVKTVVKDAKPEIPQKEQSTSTLKVGDKVVNSKGIEYEIVSIDDKGKAEVKYTTGKSVGKLGTPTNVRNLTLVGTREKTEGTLEIGGLKIPYKVEESDKNRPLATTNMKTGEITIQKGITALAMAEYLSKGNDGSVNHTIATRKTVLARLKKEYGIDFNDVIKDLDADKSNQLVRKFLLLHEYRHTLQLKKCGDGFGAAYKADPVRFELDADLFALDALIKDDKLSSIKPTKELKLDEALGDTKLLGLDFVIDNKISKIINGLSLVLDNFLYSDYELELSGKNKRQILSKIESIEIEQNKRKELLKDYNKMFEYSKERTSINNMIETIITNYKNNTNRLDAYNKILLSTPEVEIRKMNSWNDISAESTLKAGEELPNQELSDSQIKAIEDRNAKYLKANPDVKVVESDTYWWDNSAIQVVEGDTRANRAVYLAHELYHDKTAEWLRQNQNDPDVKKLQRLMDMVRDRLRKDIYSNNSDTVELLNERLRWDSGEKELGLLQENTAILLAEPNVQKALEEYIGKDRRSIVQKVIDKLKEYMFKTSEDRVNYDEIIRMVNKIERKSTKLAPVSTETMLETASPMELIEMAEQKKKC